VPIGPPSVDDRGVMSSACSGASLTGRIGRCLRRRSRLEPCDETSRSRSEARSSGDRAWAVWEVVAYQLPDEQAIADYLHGFNVPDWETRVDAIEPPLNIIKRGAHVWAQR
jgi:hypothetical protein